MSADPQARCSMSWSCCSFLRRAPTKEDPPAQKQPLRSVTPQPFFRKPAGLLFGEPEPPQLLEARTNVGGPPGQGKNSVIWLDC